MGYPQPMLHSANPRRQLPLLLATLSALLLSALAGAPLRAETREEQATLLRQLR
ncbi:MAG: hypothetical protein GWO16_09390, partial [Gammaproteobacteria bacterium]|nr:hypothetical protein [Gammaproteobacteria bacterium]NIR98174.1 hypothetical protein [Gammaproteobacteria bacterium]NIT62768.1 hypothetical protein [Gammaproteobacteria bacterium]NIV19728.1 hypothetical protein [Gammaproteobacteria bacterium]NIY31348.1 hypothetical protein [Gammaproteobacteria bacterium]